MLCAAAAIENESMIEAPGTDDAVRLLWELRDRPMLAAPEERFHAEVLTEIPVCVDREIRTRPRTPPQHLWCPPSRIQSRLDRAARRRHAYVAQKIMLHGAIRSLQAQWWQRWEGTGYVTLREEFEAVCASLKIKVDSRLARKGWDALYAQCLAIAEGQEQRGERVAPPLWVS